ncbi:MAG: hypothetical protein H6R07_2558 [Proteobacteria bacterium]|nr:hypothetical protein [Pseudomonadota bacterium]
MHGMHAGSRLYSPRQTVRALQALAVTEEKRLKPMPIRLAHIVDQAASALAFAALTED